MYCECCGGKVSSAFLGQSCCRCGAVSQSKEKPSASCVCMDCGYKDLRWYFENKNDLICPDCDSYNIAKIKDA